MHLGTHNALKWARADAPHEACGRTPVAGLMRGFFMINFVLKRIPSSILFTHLLVIDQGPKWRRRAQGKLRRTRKGRRLDKNPRSTISPDRAATRPRRRVRAPLS
ncbi:hypothetical protein PIB30_048131 [Stylosanthes scabra]|uniref:Uncharacterized protein n=1 Tax=Stylosanthes scabra TaxID=79078 RepID=A0ABU6THH2_9FABA|nr:hypothetical protein [Stylosanthes scabra]